LDVSVSSTQLACDVRTWSALAAAVSGTLFFDAGKSKRELGMEYTPIRVAFAEAIDLITDTTTRTGADERDGAMIAAEQRGRLVEEGERGDGG